MKLELNRSRMIFVKQKKRLSKLFDMYLDGEVEESLYKKKNTELENQLEELTMRYSSYTKNRD